MFNLTRTEARIAEVLSIVTLMFLATFIVSWVTQYPTETLSAFVVIPMVIAWIFTTVCIMFFSYYVHLIDNPPINEDAAPTLDNFLDKRQHRDLNGYSTDHVVEPLTDYQMTV